jgi:hypothetical protein
MFQDFEVEKNDTNRNPSNFGNCDGDFKQVDRVVICLVFLSSEFTAQRRQIFE